MKQIFLMGANFRSASACERKHLAFSGEQARELHKSILSEITDAEFCMVATCNRVEFFLLASDSPAMCNRLSTVISQHCPHFGEMRQQGKINQLQGIDAYQHLLRVTCGLESMVLGDTQIVQQVRQALQLARSVGTTGAYLEQAFGRALSLGSRVRSETSISAGSPGVAAAICDTILDWQNRAGHTPKRLLLVGAGTINTGVARMIATRAHHRLTIINRSDDRARQLATQCSGKALPWNALKAAIEDSEIVVTATSSAQPVIPRALLESMSQAACRPDVKLVIDAGMPPNVDVVALPSIELVGIDDIRQRQDQRLARRHAAIPHVERLIATELGLWGEWLAQRPLEGVLRSLYLDLASAPGRIAKCFNCSPAASPDELHYLIHRELKQLLHPHVTDLRRIVSPTPVHDLSL